MRFDGREDGRDSRDDGIDGQEGRRGGRRATTRVILSVRVRADFDRQVFFIFFLPRIKTVKANLRQSRPGGTLRQSRPDGTLRQSKPSGILFVRVRADLDRKLFFFWLFSSAAERIWSITIVKASLWSDLDSQGHIMVIETVKARIWSVSKSKLDHGHSNSQG